MLGPAPADGPPSFLICEHIRVKWPIRFCGPHSPSLPSLLWSSSFTLFPLPPLILSLPASITTVFSLQQPKIFLGQSFFSSFVLHSTYSFVYIYERRHPPSITIGFHYVYSVLIPRNTLCNFSYFAHYFSSPISFKSP